MIWICVDLAIAAVLLALLLYRPRAYRPLGIEFDQGTSDQYLQYLYRQIQRQARGGRPFDLTINQDQINRALVGRVWLDPSGQVSVSGLTITISDDGIKVMATAQLGGVGLVVLGGIHPRLDQDGWLHLDVTKVKIGALNLTPVALAIARRMYNQRLQDGPVDTEDLRAKIAAALLDGAAFDPVLEVGDGHVRVIGLTLQPGQAVLRIMPVGRITGAVGWPHGPSFLAVKGGLTFRELGTYVPTLAHPSSATVSLLAKDLVMIAMNPAILGPLSSYHHALPGRCLPQTQQRQCRSVSLADIKCVIEM